MAENLVKFQQGLLANLSKQAVSNGTLWFTTDEGAIYLDTEGKRVRFGDYVTVDSITELPAAGHAYESALYYAKAENVLARWDASSNKWVQLNAAGLTQVKREGATGNVITGLKVVTDSVTGAKVLTYTAANMATAGEVSTIKSAVDTLTGDVNTTGSVANQVKAAKDAVIGTAEDAAGTATINGALKSAAAAKAAADAAQGTANEAKTQAGTNKTNISNLTARVAQNETDISGLKTQVGTGKVDDRIATAKGEVLGSASDTADKNTVYGAKAQAAAAQTTANAANAQATTNKTDISTLKGRVDQAETDIDTLEGKVNTLTAGKSTEGSVAYQIAQVVAGAPENFDTLKEIADWIVNDKTGAASLNSRLTAVEGVNNTQDAKIQALEAADVQIKKDFAAADTALENKLVGTATDGYKTLGDLETKIKANATAAANAKAAADKAQGDATKNAGAISTLQSTVSGHTTSIGTLETNLGNLTTTVTNLDAAYKAADTALETKLVGGETSYNTFKKAGDAIRTNASGVSNNAAKISALETQLTWGTFA